MHEGGGSWVGSNKLVELKKKTKKNHYEVPFHTSQNGCDPKVYK